MNEFLAPELRLRFSVFVLGALTASCWFVGHFFLKFWRTSKDSFFLFFAMAFWILGLQWMGLAFSDADSEMRTGFYLARLTAFMMIVWAIIKKNRDTRP
jgi:hypothetical protein